MCMAVNMVIIVRKVPGKSEGVAKKEVDENGKILVLLLSFQIHMGLMTDFSLGTALGQDPSATNGNGMSQACGEVRQ